MELELLAVVEHDRKLIVSELWSAVSSFLPCWLEAAVEGRVLISRRFRLDLLRTSTEDGLQCFSMIFSRELDFLLMASFNANAIWRFPLFYRKEQMPRFPFS